MAELDVHTRCEMSCEILRKTNDVATTWTPGISGWSRKR